MQADRQTEKETDRHKDMLIAIMHKKPDQYRPMQPRESVGVPLGTRTHQKIR